MSEMGYQPFLIATNGPQLPMGLRHGTADASPMGRRQSNDGRSSMAAGCPVRYLYGVVSL
jgi:hypothetical protein